MSAYTYLLTEGVHDVAFLGKLLQAALAFERVNKAAELDQFWTRILPVKWPHNGSLRPSVPAPNFYRHSASGTSVAVVNAQGIGELTKILKTHRDALALDGLKVDAVGVVLDADADELPTNRFARMADALSKSGFPRPLAAEAVLGTPRVGVFVLPGGGAQGTLEHLLLDCAAAAYPTLHAHAVRFVSNLDRTASEFSGDELKDFKAPSGVQKTTVSAMSAILKPGRAVQATLEDHQWLSNHTLKLPRIAALLKFLGDLTGLPPSAGASTSTT